jgi:carbamoylphosphate synthase large subunit
MYNVKWLLDVGQRHVQDQTGTVQIEIGISFKEVFSKARRRLETKLTGIH